jgi:hypothetical protein
MGNPPPNPESLLGVILTEGRHCRCRHEDTCPDAGNEWCRRLVRKEGGVITSKLEPPDTRKCLYGDKPGCCWVLEAVESLASDYLTRAEVHSPPVPSELINFFDESRNIEVRLVPLKALHGAVWLLGEEWVIQLNGRDPQSVRRYSMFHEAFHIAYRIAYPAFNKTELRITSFNEVLADHFATCFLMPREWVEEHWPKVQDVRVMARKFDVPLKQMKKRLKQLNLLPEAEVREQQ